jgi:hypothetical protein
MAVDRQIPVTGPSTMAALAALINEELNRLYNAIPMVIGSVAGTNTITGTVTPSVTSYTSGQMYLLTPSAQTTSTVTLNINSLGALAVVDKTGAALSVSKFMRSGSTYLLLYNGTHLRIINDTLTNLV